MHSRILLLLVALQTHLAALLAAYKHQLLSYYIQTNLRYIGPRIQYHPTNIPEEFYARYGPLDFKRFFRMNLSTFQHLEQALKDAYLRNSGLNRVQRLFGWKLGIFLRFLARAECLQSLKITFGCCIETARSSIFTFQRLILFAFKNLLYTDVNDEQALQDSSNAISVLTQGVLDGFPFIIDGTHVPITKLPANIPRQCFYNRKGGRTINCQAVINASLKIVSFDCGYPGSTNDSQMLGLSSFLQLLIEIYTKYSRRFGYLADNGYPTREYMMTPYTAAEILRCENTEADKVQFNMIFSSVRQAVERVFGILQKKWYLLVVGCEYDIDDYLKFIQCIVLVHNFMIDCDMTYKQSIMNDNWELDGTPNALLDSIAQLNSLRSDEAFLEENAHSDLALGEQRRDIILMGMPNVLTQKANELESMS